MATPVPLREVFDLTHPDSNIIFDGTLEKHAKPSHRATPVKSVAFKGISL